MISIVMPTYNQGRFIAQAVKSILDQTYGNFELVIVDDGSTDNTPEIISSLTDSRIKKIQKTNGGTGSALNAGFSVTSGQYETWFASDNILYPTAFDELRIYLDQHPDIDYVYGNCDIGIMNAAGDVETARKNLKDEVKQEWVPGKLMNHYFLGIAWLWRKSLREKAGWWFQAEPCEDYDMVLRMEDCGGKFAFHDVNLAWFRRHKENMTNEIMKKKIAGGDPHYYSKLVQRKSKIRRGMPV